MSHLAASALISLLLLAPGRHPDAAVAGEVADAYAAVQTYRATWVRETPSKRRVTEVVFDRASLRFLEHDSSFILEDGDWIPSPGGIIRVNDGQRVRRAFRSSLANHIWETLEDEEAPTTEADLASRIRPTAEPDLALLVGADPIDVCSRKGGRLSALPDDGKGPGFRAVDVVPWGETIVRLDAESGLVRSIRFGESFELHCVEMTIDQPLDERLFDFDAGQAEIETTFAVDRARRCTAELPGLLRDYLDGDLPDDELEITYDDLSRFHVAGTRITLNGGGAVDHETFERLGAARPVDRDGVEEVVRLLLDLEAWEQRARQDENIACGSYAFLRIRAGSASSVVWENANDLGRHNRLRQIREAMTRLAFAPRQNP